MITMTTTVSVAAKSVGYVSAPLTLRSSSALASIIAARRMSMVSREPLSSPACTRLMKSALKIRGCRDNASLRLLPPKRSLRITPRALRMEGFET